MQISGNFSVSGVDAARSLQRSDASNAVSGQQAAAPSGISLPADQLDLSPEALAVGANDSSGEVFRADRVAQLRQEIANGDYDTDEKLDIAMQRMLEKFA